MFARRVILLLICIAAMIALCLGRLATLQFFRGEASAAMLAGRLTRRTTLHAPRGDLLDRHGRILATDLPCYSLKMDYRALLLNFFTQAQTQAQAEAGTDTDIDIKKSSDLAAAPAASDEAAPDAINAPLAATPPVAPPDADAAELGEDKLVDRWIAQQARQFNLPGDATARRAALAARVEYTLEMASLVTGTPRETLDADARAIIRRIRRIRRRVGMPVAEQMQLHTLIENLGEGEAVDIRARAEQAVGMSVGPDELRWYPYGPLACHLIGRVSRVTADTLAEDPWADDPLLCYRGDERVGASGAEKLCEAQLRPRRGWSFRDTLRDIELVQPARRGQDVRLGLDIELQTAVARLMNDQHANGAVVILDIATGEMLAAVSLPQYDLNTFNSDYASLIEDEDNRPLLNRVISGLYPPGSTLKPLTALAGLCEGEIDLTSTFLCRGHADPRRPRCWSVYGHGELSVVEAIMNSCNAFFSRTAEQLGPERLAGWYRRFGYGRPPGTGLVGEAAGNVPDTDWMQQRYHRDFYVSEIRSMAIGQGAMLATPLQVATATAAIARGAVYLPPTPLLDGNDRTEPDDMRLPPAFVAAVREGMKRVVNDPESQTAYSHVERHPARFAGKTGTAQVGGTDDDMAWFTAYAPVETPRIALAVILEYAGSGGTHCVPLTEDIIDACELLGYLDPPATPATPAAPLSISTAATAPAAHAAETHPEATP